MKLVYMLALAALISAPAAAFADKVAPQAAMEKPAAEKPSYTVAVLPFTASGKDLEDMGHEAPLLVNAFMSASPSLMLVERGEIDKAMSEIELGKSGTVDPATAAKVGQLLGAQVLVTGRLMPVQKDIVIVSKVIGVETGRVYGETITMPARGSIKDAAQELAQKLSANIESKGATLIAKEEDKEDIVAKLKPLTEGKKDLPTVSVTIDAMNINRSDTDGTAQTEIGYILKNLGFTIIDTMASNKKADIEVTGNAISEFAMRKGNLVSAKARVEIKAIKRASGSVVLIDREPTVAVDLSPESAGKEAQARGASALAGRLVKAILASEK